MYKIIFTRFDYLHTFYIRYDIYFLFTYIHLYIFIYIDIYIFRYIYLYIINLLIYWLYIYIYIYITYLRLIPIPNTIYFDSTRRFNSIRRHPIRDIAAHMALNWQVKKRRRHHQASRTAHGFRMFEHVTGVGTCSGCSNIWNLWRYVYYTLCIYF